MAVDVGTPNNPSILGNQPGSHNYLNSQMLGDLALAKPEFFPNLILRYGRQELGDLLKMIPGFSKGSSGAEIVRHAEEDFIMSGVTVQGHAAGTNGAAVELTVATANVGEIEQTEPYPGAGESNLKQSRIIPVKGDLLQFKNRVWGVVSEVTESTGKFKVIPVDENEKIPQVLENEKIAITGSVSEEFAGARASTSSRFINYKNYMGHTRMDFDISHRAAGEPIWVNVPDRNGNMTPQWFMKGIADQYHRLMNHVNLMHLDGKVITNPAVAAIDGLKTVQRTMGVIEATRKAGNVEQYTSGAMTLSDIENMVLTINRNKGPRDYMGLIGLGFQSDFNSLIRNGDGADLWSGATNPGRLIFKQFENNQKQGLSLDIDYVKYLGVTFAMKRADAFDDGQTLGLIPLYSKLGLFIPMGKTVMYDRDSPGSSAEVPTVRLVEKDTKLGIKGYHEWFTGVAPKYGVATNDKQGLYWHAIYSAAIETFAINRFVLMTGDASS